MSETSANYTTGLTAQHMLETQPLPCLLRYLHPPATTLHTPETQARTFSTDPEMHATPKRQHSSAKAIQHPARPYSPTARHSVPAQQSSGKAAWRGCPEISHLQAATHHNIDTTTDTEQHNNPPPAPPTQQRSSPAASQQPTAPPTQQHDAAAQKYHIDQRQHITILTLSSIAVHRQANDRQRLVSPAPTQQRHTQNKKPGQRSTAAPVIAEASTMP